MEIITDDINKYNKDWWDRFYQFLEHQESEDEAESHKVVAGIIGNGSVIEIGCGEGHFIKYVKGKYVGIDLSEIVINRNKQKFPDKEFYAIDFENFKTNEHFDYAVAFEVFEHLPEPQKLVKKMLELSNCAIIVLPYGIYGKLVVEYDRSLLQPLGATEYHYATYTEEDIKKMFPTALVFRINERKLAFMIKK